MTQPRSRRSIGAVVAASAVLVAVTASLPATGTHVTEHTESMRARYHLTPPENWLSDPQRPIYADGKYHAYYLQSDQNNGYGGWRHATTTDNVVFKDEGIAIPKAEDFPVWSGSGVVDTDNTAGFGAGAIVVLATQPTDGDRFQQEQYLWYSTDGGYTFTEYGPPVIENPDGSDWFRDPKIEWDEANDEWVAVIGRHQEASFYTSPDLKNWTFESTFSYTSPNIGGMECPDLFRIKADDGTWHWVFGASMQGDLSGLPNTYAYWTGDWNGTEFVPDTTDPQWLDWGTDWYAAVSWPNQDSPDTSRFAMGWMNNWQYAPRAVPTDHTDGYNGQMSIVREIQLAEQADGSYTLLSQPASSLDDIVTREINPPDVTVDGTHDLEYHGTAYRLDVDIDWTTLNNVGISVGQSADKTRHTNIGIVDDTTVYLDRANSDLPNYTFGEFQKSESTIPATNSVHLTIFVDHSSVEVFVDDGEVVHSSQVYFEPGDTGISLYTDGGSADFTNMTISEFQDITTAADRGAPYEDFEASDYGDWTTTGTAFGSEPAEGTLPDQQTVTGYLGDRLANSYVDGDASTGTLSSPSFTIDKPYLNVLVGGGDHPRPPELFADFEGESWGDGWTATGDFVDAGPTASNLPNQEGDQVLDTYIGDGDPATGTITSPEFTITRDYIDFLIAGGDHPWGQWGSTVVNLLVDGVVHRTATGNDSDTMVPVSWDVHDLVGRTAQIEIVDNNAGHDWGHFMVDQILFADRPEASVNDPDEETTVNLVVDDTVVRTATGDDSEHLTWSSWNVADLAGKSAHIEIVDNNTGAWGHILADHITLDDRPAS